MVTGFRVKNGVQQPESDSITTVVETTVTGNVVDSKYTDSSSSSILTTLSTYTTTMAISTTTTSSTSSTSSSTSTSTGVATHTIQVGPKTSPHAYVPHNITANPGDTVIFEFYPTNHSIAKADYEAPCVPASKDIFWSEPFATFDEEDGELVGSPPTWSLLINDTEGLQNSSMTWETQYKKALIYPYMLLPGQSMPAEGSTSSSGSSSSSSTSSSSHGLGTGAIAGIAVACAAFVIILIALVWTLGRNRLYSKWMSSQDGRTERAARWTVFNSHPEPEPEPQSQPQHQPPVAQKSELDSNTGYREPPYDSTYYSGSDPSRDTASEGTGTNTSSMYGAFSLQRGSGQWNWDTQPRSQRGPSELDATSVLPLKYPYERQYR
ncbi:hypothetical protein N7478_010967 [Penicillium angulare]|uniref:uncharacterized protein n=1 Tax=Penicillium angulare TaxID=116970 RepID=UPI00254063B0|nr:uncharacterized protein N7478_010967 [Penicillium angulare]KAJ5263362.1 hypothetical protein N7478_010967 [Penicillium angulare]